MANSKYAYVRSFELPDPLLPGTFLLFRLDGHSFHRFSETHGFEKPNDVRALRLMDRAAQDVMEAYPDVVLAFGESDEYSFLLKRSTSLYNRRRSKISTTLTSLFTSSYVFHWPSYLPDTPLRYPPSFDGRIVLYPSEKEVRDYFAWRQADTHINNLYNTAFWALVMRGGRSTAEAHADLRGTYAKDKHEILFSQFGINYNTLDARFRKGSVLVREAAEEEEGEEEEEERAEEVPSTSTSTSPSTSPGDAVVASEDTTDDHVPPTPTPPESEVVVAAVAEQTQDEGGAEESEPANEPLSEGGSQGVLNDQPTTKPGPEPEAPLSPTTSSQPQISNNQKQKQKQNQNQNQNQNQEQQQKQKKPKPEKKKKKKKKNANANANATTKPRTKIVLLHCDIIKDEFWNARPEVLADS